MSTTPIARDTHAVSLPPSSIRLRLAVLLVIFGAAMAAIVSLLIVSGRWQLAVGLILIVPALLVVHRVPFLTVVIWLAVMPFLMHTDTSAERYLYWILHRGLPLVTLLMILLTAVLGMRDRGPLPKLGVAELAMAGYLIAGTLSIVWQSPTPVPTFYLFYDRAFVPMFLYLIIRLAPPRENELRWLLPVAVFVVVTQSAIGLISWVAPQLLPGKWLTQLGERTIGTLVNASIFTIAIMFGGLLLLQAAQHAQSRIARWLFVSCFLLTIYSTFASFSRASWLAGVLIGAGLILTYPRFMTKLAVIVLPVAVVLGSAVLTSQIEWARQRLYSAEAENSALSRVPIMVGAYNMFLAKPAFGWGYDNFDLFDRSFYGRLGDVAGDNKDHASHNFYLTILAEQGAVGFLLFMTPLFWWFSVSVSRFRRMSATGFRGKRLLIMFWLVILCQVVLSNFINMIVIYGLGIWWITLGLIGYLIEDESLMIPISQPNQTRRVALTHV